MLARNTNPWQKAFWYVGTKPIWTTYFRIDFNIDGAQIIRLDCCVRDTINQNRKFSKHQQHTRQHYYKNYRRYKSRYRCSYYYITSMETPLVKYNIPRYKGVGGAKWSRIPERKKRGRGRKEYNPEYLKLLEWLQSFQNKTQSFRKISVSVKNDVDYKIIGEGIAFSGCSGCGFDTEVTPYCAIVIDVSNNRYRCPNHKFGLTSGLCGDVMSFYPDAIKPVWQPLSPKQQQELRNLLPTIIEMIKI